MLNKQAIDKLQRTTDLNQINNPKELAMFLAQCDHESCGFKIFAENFNYSAERLLQVFPKYFDEDLANDYANHPCNIASRVYANRMGNGDEKSMDGWKYKGRGAIQITGKQMYKLCGDGLKLDLIENPDLLLKFDNAINSAVWFWHYKCLTNLMPDIKGITKRINGGLNGLNERQKLYNQYCKILNI